MNPRVLFLGHAGVLGGVESSLRYIARRYADSSRVQLFAGAPFASDCTRLVLRLKCCQYRTW